jgi:hypothetical protein
VTADNTICIVLTDGIKARTLDHNPLRHHVEKKASLHAKLIERLIEEKLLVEELIPVAGRPNEYVIRIALTVMKPQPEKLQR